MSENTFYFKDTTYLITRVDPDIMYFTPFIVAESVDPTEHM